ncbi:uncharacterized protein L201_005712 [Kwoniella dendrophila CBS 6074]|uniref:Uncharacterized protein n=1 Tax=Kwoniella dendrophila CBS 6074 TaxID=1295534 RepID=A0AAX4JZF8_9TREE
MNTYTLNSNSIGKSSSSGSSRNGQRRTFEQNLACIDEDQVIDANSAMIPSKKIFRHIPHTEQQGTSDHEKLNPSTISIIDGDDRFYEDLSKDLPKTGITDLRSVMNIIWPKPTLNSSNVTIKGKNAVDDDQNNDIIVNYELTEEEVKERLSTYLDFFQQPDEQSEQGEPLTKMIGSFNSGKNELDMNERIKDSRKLNEYRSRLNEILLENPLESIRNIVREDYFNKVSNLINKYTSTTTDEERRITLQFSKFDWMCTLTYIEDIPSSGTSNNNNNNPGKGKRKSTTTKLVTKDKWDERMKNCNGHQYRNELKERFMKYEMSLFRKYASSNFDSNSNSISKDDEEKSLSNDNDNVDYKKVKSNGKSKREKLKNKLPLLFNQNSQIPISSMNETEEEKLQKLDQSWKEFCKKWDESSKSHTEQNIRERLNQDENRNRQGFSSFKGFSNLDPLVNEIEHSKMFDKNEQSEDLFQILIAQNRRSKSSLRNNFSQAEADQQYVNLINKLNTKYGVKSVHNVQEMTSNVSAPSRVTRSDIQQVDSILNRLTLPSTDSAKDD